MILVSNVKDLFHLKQVFYQLHEGIIHRSDWI